MAKPKKITKVLNEFVRQESAGGIFMLGATILALLLANSPISTAYEDTIAPIKGFAKDILMVAFFFMVGLELKREMVDGFLKKKSQIMLPLIAALGGMIIPALIFIMFNSTSPENMAGWAIPSATDIAFAVLVLTLAGKNIPPAVKVFLLAIAIFDDLGAVVIIALFYSAGLDYIYVLAAIGLVIALYFTPQKIESLIFYAVFCVILAYLLHEAGIHTTIAGVITGLAVPKSILKGAINKLHPFVSFIVLPLFAFVSAGVAFVSIDLALMLSPLPLGIAIGLFAGKQIGIFGTTWILVKSGLVSKPKGAKWIHIYIVSILAGIGFTMSLFIGLLAFSDPATHELIKLGVIAGSILSTVAGVIALKLIR